MRPRQPTYILIINDLMIQYRRPGQTRSQLLTALSKA
jgi:hypothetical protein